MAQFHVSQALAQSRLQDVPPTAQQLLNRHVEVSDLAGLKHFTRVVVGFDLPEKLRGLLTRLGFCHFVHLLHHDALAPSGVSFGLMPSIHLGPWWKLIFEKCCDIHLLIVPSGVLLLHETRCCKLGFLRAATSKPVPKVHLAVGEVLHAGNAVTHLAGKEDCLQPLLLLHSRACEVEPAFVPGTSPGGSATHVLPLFYSFLCSCFLLFIGCILTDGDRVHCSGFLPVLLDPVIRVRCLED
mmetsp:Transcript_74118/g.176727  ORF Transcript_74118/g.176727 Transcript_74118/m.176727 type:complete len:240 (-) Transcript_74118:169-888(-)